MDVFSELGRLGLVPVVEIPDAALALPLGRALLEAGLPCAEITFRTTAAAAAIRILRDELPELLVGAGTVLDIEQADAAIAAVRHAMSRGALFVPGICTPSEIEAARGIGCDVLKFFPAEAAGGVDFLKAVAGPYRDVRFVPTGGIGPANLASYLALAQVVACGGSWMVPKKLIAGGEFAAIGRLAAEAVALARVARPAAAVTA
jgi:Entner-Doudoroff aldolase